MKFFEDYPEFNGYPDPPYLLRLQEAEGIPNNSLNRALLNRALKNNRAASTNLLERLANLPATGPESQDWVPYKSPWISDEEAGIREAYENAVMEEANRDLLLIARENYNRLYENIRDVPAMALDEDIRVMLMPKILEKMIEREQDYVKRFHQRFLMNSFFLWLSERSSSEPNTNFLYYPYHMILDYREGNEAHKVHLEKFFNDKAREVIRKRLVKANLFSDRREYFDFTSGHPSEWHSAAHQNTSVEHSYFDLETANIPQFQALGNYSLGALARGHTMPAGGGKHYICITNAYSFVNDSFDFNGFFQWLGNWDFENGDFSVVKPMDMRVFNSTFRGFAKRTKHGHDFRIVSPLYEIPTKELEFDGKEIINGNICWKVTR